MCKCASFVVLKDAVKWLPLSDSHEDIIAHYKLHEGAGRVNFVRVEISPEGNNLSLPLVNWQYKVDQSDTPDWYDAEAAERRTRAELKKWAKRKLTGWNVKEAFNPVNPFKLKPRPLSRDKALALVKQWASVWDSVGASVWVSVRDSVWDSVGASVGASVWVSVRDSVWAGVRDSVGDSVWASFRASVGDSVRDSVWDSVWAYCGGLFVPKIKVWKHAEKLGANPWKPLTTLWHMGYVPSFDGKVWRLHCGPKAEVKYEFTAEEIPKERK